MGGWAVNGLVCSVGSGVWGPSCQAILAGSLWGPPPLAPLVTQLCGERTYLGTTEPPPPPHTPNTHLPKLTRIDPPNPTRNGRCATSPAG